MQIADWLLQFNLQSAIVIGGGLAGLTAALNLAEAGARPLLLEADLRLGGRLAGGDTVSLEHGGRSWQFTAEHGIHLTRPAVVPRRAGSGSRRGCRAHDGVCGSYRG